MDLQIMGKIANGTARITLGYCVHTDSPALKSALLGRLRSSAETVIVGIDCVPAVSRQIRELLPTLG